MGPTINVIILKRKRKYFKMYKYIKIANSFTNFFVRLVTKPRKKRLKQKPNKDQNMAH